LFSLLTDTSRAKYPLACVEKVLDAFGEGLGGGFDIGCKFKTTLNNSPLGPRAHELCHTCLVGAFHGHAHNRLCQLSHLATYVKGLGLEDLEGCERAFSKSNALAPSLRYASIFHQKQAISTYFEHNDVFKVYQNLSKLYHDSAMWRQCGLSLISVLLATFLLNNYKQALNILDKGPRALEQAMNDLHISDKKVFESWLEEERAYLRGLRKEPEEETLQMEYWQKLVNLQGSEYVAFVNNKP
jgi:hypothetical protein